MKIALGIAIGLAAYPLLSFIACLLLPIFDNDNEADHIRSAEEMEILAKSEWADRHG
jgi:hypothetical protein